MKNYIYKKYLKYYKGNGGTRQEMADDLGISLAWLSELMYAGATPSAKLIVKITAIG